MGHIFSSSYYPIKFMKLYFKVRRQSLWGIIEWNYANQLPAINAEKLFTKIMYHNMWVFNIYNRCEFQSITDIFMCRFDWLVFKDEL